MSKKRQVFFLSFQLHCLLPQFNPQKKKKTKKVLSKHIFCYLVKLPKKREKRKKRKKGKEANILYYLYCVVISIFKIKKKYISLLCPFCVLKQRKRKKKKRKERRQHICKQDKAKCCGPATLCSVPCSPAAPSFLSLFCFRCLCRRVMSCGQLGKFFLALSFLFAHFLGA